MPAIYSDQFKADAVALVEEGMSQKRVCADLGISKTALSQWVRKADAVKYGLSIPVDPVEAKHVSAALRRIRELEEENEILRRAAAYLSRANLRSPK